MARESHALWNVTEEQYAALRKEAERYKAAQNQFMEALGVLWNSQVDMVVPLGDRDMLERIVAGPLNLWNDCNCC